MFSICEEHANLLPLSFERALSLAEKLIKSPKYQKSFRFLLPETDAKELKELLAKYYIISIIESKEYLGLYGIISKTPLIKDKIFLNPLMLNQMRLREIRSMNDNRVIEKNVLFLCIKIVREFSHLLNYSLNKNKSEPITLEKSLAEINPDLVSETEKKLEEHRKLSTKCDEITIECYSILFTAETTKIDDFGEMMEILLFGGVIEHKEPTDQTSFAIDEIIIYDFAGASNAKWSKKIFVDISKNSKLIKDVFYNYKSFTGKNEIEEEEIKPRRRDVRF